MIYAEERYNNIMRLLTEKGRISSAELSSALNISRETIRRDLNRLAQEGRLVKTRGGPSFRMPADKPGLSIHCPREG